MDEDCLRRKWPRWLEIGSLEILLIGFNEITANFKPKCTAAQKFPKPFSMRSEMDLTKQRVSLEHLFFVSYVETIRVLLTKPACRSMEQRSKFVVEANSFSQRPMQAFLGSHFPSEKRFFLAFKALPSIVLVAKPYWDMQKKCGLVLKIWKGQTRSDRVMSYPVVLPQYNGHSFLPDLVGTSLLKKMRHCNFAGNFSSSLTKRAEKCHFWSLWSLKELFHEWQKKGNVISAFQESYGDLGNFGYDIFCYNQETWNNDDLCLSY